MLRKISSGTVALAAVCAVHGQDSTGAATLVVSGSADVYYKYDFAKATANTRTSFTATHNSFALGMASVKLSRRSGKTAMVADLGFGPRAQEFSYNDAGVLSAIKQLYLSCTALPWLTLTAGTWATQVGYESVDPAANRNYSMSYLFTNGPFFHTGIKAEVSTGKNGFMVGLANASDYKYIPDGFLSKKFLLAQYSFSAGDRFKGFLNYVGGQAPDTARLKQLDLVLSSTLGNQFSLAVNGTVAGVNRYAGKDRFEGYKSWWGAALYGSYNPAGCLGFTLREEYFNDKSGLRYSSLAGGGSILATTLSAQLHSGNLLLIPEWRVDVSNKALFVNSRGTAVKTAASVLLAAVYSF